MNFTSLADHDVIWDKSMCVFNAAVFDAKKLMASAFKGPLPLAQQQQLQHELESEPKLVYHIGLKPSKVSVVLICSVNKCTVKFLIKILYC